LNAGPARGDAPRTAPPTRAKQAAATVTAGQKSGKEPLRGFDELKQLWRERQ
jgi:hypothetical protein